MSVLSYIKEKVGQIVDVRTEMEYSMGNVEGSINIPMNEVPERLDELRAMEAPLILICQSGNRSGQVMHYLMSEGFENVHNGGGWMDVLHIRNS